MVYGKREDKSNKLDYSLVDVEFFKLLHNLESYYKRTQIEEIDAFSYLMNVYSMRVPYEFLSTSALFFVDYKDFYEILKLTVERMQESLQYHERDNWKLGLSARGCIGSAIRHWVEYRLGNTDENHFGAFVFNIMCVYYFYNNDKFKGDKNVRDLFSEKDNV